MGRYLLLLSRLLTVSAIAQEYHSPPGKDVALFAPKPEYPYEARAYHVHGSGIYLLHLRADGTVRSVDVKKSTGYRILDDAAVTAYRKWRFRPGTIRTITIPLSFAMDSQ